MAHFIKAASNLLFHCVHKLKFAHSVSNPCFVISALKSLNQDPKAFL
jgi:hypothetical protein